ncbi:uncharacterized protein BP5553_00004 [Venustampulla echinocandica]|uniref:Uncharacterized protein n=1 Tax=Venustampulla echinocandica TaxID=2656787 RepID=A0A370TWX6_9HELO|nr:uncharacterized protein BP5553_00004 [Venustampulla echinocandica]RDL40025.1 hypothetical protein BP5553_00004 [Venustampulla echinocandica]
MGAQQQRQQQLQQQLQQQRQQQALPVGEPQRVQAMENARQLQMQMMGARQQQQQQQQALAMGARPVTNSPSRTPAQMPTMQMHQMGSAYDDLIMEPADSQYSSATIASFESACQPGPLSNIQTRNPDFLHRCLIHAISTGNLEIARDLLSTGAPIVRHTPNSILTAPSAQQISLFELFTEYGWTPNTPGCYGAMLLPCVVTNLPLLKWFLVHGANPNLGVQSDYRDRLGGPDTDSCAALQKAASTGTLEAVHLLLDAGAQIRNGTPLHCAAGACPPGTPLGAPLNDGVTPSKEFDTSRIPVMALLVERGADVNQAQESRHKVAKYPIVHAVLVGAVERVKWLLENGADPEARGAWGSAVECAKWRSSAEMKRVLNINTP